MNNITSDSDDSIEKNTIKRFERRKTRQVNVGNVIIGGNAPISIQTMTKTKTADVKSTVEQIARSVDAGADLVRVTVNDNEAAEAIKEIVKQSSVPIIADIHFNYIYALKSIEAGVAKVRINPGNIGSRDRIKQVLDKAKEHQIPIRIGVNSGSLETDILEKYAFPTAEALYESALRHVEIALDMGFEDIVVSVKSTSVPLMIDAYRLISKKTDFPLHLGVTEAGLFDEGTVKSSVGIGTLLSLGIGDTVRVSLTDDPEKEVQVGRQILRSLNLMRPGIEIISCPTCGRVETDLVNIARELKAKLANIKKDLTIALLGCPVNGIGEAREANLGIAAGRGEGILFINGQVVRKIKEEDFVSVMYEEVMNY